MNIKTFLGMQEQHGYILAQQEARKKYIKRNRLDDVTYDKIRAIPDRTTNKKLLANLKKLKDL